MKHGVDSSRNLDFVGLLELELFVLTLLKKLILSLLFAKIGLDLLFLNLFADWNLKEELTQKINDFLLHFAFLLV